MSTPTNAREARLQCRFEQLTSGDAQLVAAQPDPAITAAIDAPGVVLADVIRTVDDRLRRPARPRPARRRVRHRRLRPHRRRVAAPLRHPDLPRDLGAGPGPRRRADRQPRAARRPRRDARLHQRRLRRRRHGAVPDRSRRRPAADQRARGAAAPDPGRDRARRDPLQRRPPRRRRRTRAHRPCARAPGGVRLPPRRSTTTARPSSPPPPGWPTRTSPSKPSTTSSPRAPSTPTGRSRPRPRRRPAPADLHLRQHRHPQGRDVHRPPDGQLLARLVRPRLGHRRQAAGDHPELHADQPRHGPRHPVLHAGRRRHRLLRRQERPVHPARRPRAGAPDQARLRPPHLGDAVPGSAERGRPPRRPTAPTATTVEPR